MWTPQSFRDRSLTNGLWSPPERRDPNAPVTGQHSVWHPASRRPSVSGVLAETRAMNDRLEASLASMRAADQRHH